MHPAFLAAQPGMSRVVCLLVTLLVAAPGLCAEPNRQPRGRLLPRQLVAFEIVLGRLQLSQESFRIGSAHERIELAGNGQRTRSLSVSVLHGRPTLQFQDVGGEEEWKIQVKADQQVQLCFVSRVEPMFKTLTYEQPAVGPIAIEVSGQQGQPRHRVTADSLWHLLLENPDFFYTYIEPVLQRLEPAWEFHRSREQIIELVQDHAAPSTVSSVVASALVKLDSTSAAERSASCREIEKLGLSARIELQNARAHSNNCQQQCAIDQLLSELRPAGNDTAMRIAVWLQGDIELCQTMAGNRYDVR